MKYTYELILYYQDGSTETIKRSTIIKEIDDYTTQFETPKEMCLHHKCASIQLKYGNSGRTGYLPILYKNDKFKKQSVLYRYLNYLSKSPEKRDNFLKKVSRTISRGETPQNRFDERCLTIYNHFDENKELYKPILTEILKSYFGSQTVIYIKYRQAYIELKQNGIKVECYQENPNEIKSEKQEERTYKTIYTTDIVVAELLKNYDGEFNYKDVILYLMSKKLNPKQYASVKVTIEGQELPEDCKYVIYNPTISKKAR